MEEITRRRFVKIGVAAGATLAVGGGLAAAGKAASSAPEPEQPRLTMGDGMSKVLVVYGTGTGCTTGVAEQIGKTLATKGATVDVAPVKDAPDPSGYDAVVVGSGVRGGQWHAAVNEWVKAKADALKAKPVAFYTVGLTLASDPTKTDEVRAYTDPLIAETGVKPVDVGTFAGWNEPKTFSFVERAILKMMKAPQGDFRDFAKIDAWAAAMQPKLA